MINLNKIYSFSEYFRICALDLHVYSDNHILLNSKGNTQFEFISK